MEVIKKKVVFEDTSKIKAVHFHSPELQTENNENYVIGLYGEIKEIESTIGDLRMKIADMEQELNAKYKEMRNISNLCVIEFPTYEKEITDYKVALFLKNTGNDIIGYKDS